METHCRTTTERNSDVLSQRGGVPAMTAEPMTCLKPVAGQLACANHVPCGFAFAMWCRHTNNAQTCGTNYECKDVGMMRDWGHVMARRAVKHRIVYHARVW